MGFLEGQSYDVYVRVHNNRCSPVSDILVKVFATSPVMDGNADSLEARGDKIDITGGLFLPDPDGDPSGLDMSGGSLICPGPDNAEEDNWALIGPFEWTPTMGNAGHRCLIALIKSDADDPIGAEKRVPLNNNIAQRNVQVVGGNMPTEAKFINPLDRSADAALEFRCNRLPIYTEGTSVEMRIDYIEAMGQAWTDVPGTEYSYVQGDEKAVVKMKRCNLRMPAVTLPAFTELEMSVTGELPEGWLGRYDVNFVEHLDGVVLGGMTFPIGNIIVE
jgi:hypothetical protein